MPQHEYYHTAGVLYKSYRRRALQLLEVKLGHVFHPTSLGCCSCDQRYSQVTFFIYTRNMRLVRTTGKHFVCPVPSHLTAALLTPLSLKP